MTNIVCPAYNWSCFQILILAKLQYRIAEMFIKLMMYDAI